MASQTANAAVLKAAVEFRDMGVTGSFGAENKEPVVEIAERVGRFLALMASVTANAQGEFAFSLSAKAHTHEAVAEMLEQGVGHAALPQQPLPVPLDPLLVGRIEAN